MAGNTNALFGTPEKHRQHYVPQVFLRRFVDHKKRIHCLRRRDDESVQLLLNQSTENVAVINDLYEFPLTEHGGTFLDPNGIEDANCVFESNCKKMFSRVDSLLGNLAKEQVLADEDLSWLATVLSTFVAAIEVRQPGMVGDYREHSRQLVELLEDNNVHIQDVFEELFLGTAGHPYGVSTEPPDPIVIASWLKTGLSMLPNWDQEGNLILENDFMRRVMHLRECSLGVLYSTDDHPFVGLNTPYIVEMPQGTNACYWPFSPWAALLFVNDGKRVLTPVAADGKTVNSINREAIASGEWEWAFCPSEVVIRDLHEGMLVR